MVLITDIDLSDPGLWVAAGIILMAVTFFMIYFKVFVGETRMRR